MDTDISIVAILDKLDLVIGDTAEISFRTIKNGLMVKISYRFFGEIKDVRYCITHQEIESFDGNCITHNIDLMIKELEED